MDRRRLKHALLFLSDALDRITGIEDQRADKILDSLSRYFFGCVVSTLRSTQRLHRKVDAVTDLMLRYGWDSLWYANPLEARGSRKRLQHFGPRWHVGVWSGPDGDLLCLKHCDTNREAQKWLSPDGWTPEEAAKAAGKKLRVLRGRALRRSRRKVKS